MEVLRRLVVFPLTFPPYSSSLMGKLSSSASDPERRKTLTFTIKPVSEALDSNATLTLLPPLLPFQTIPLFHQDKYRATWQSDSSEFGASPLSAEPESGFAA